MSDNFFSRSFADAKLDSKIGRAVAEIDWVIGQVGKTDSVLDLGCGRGRLAIEIAKRGSAVVAIDINQEYLKVGRARAGSLGIEWRHQDERNLDDVDSFDLIISAFTSFGYHSDEENTDVLRRISRALRMGATFVLETTNRDGAGHLVSSANVERTDDRSLIVKEYEFDPRTSRRKTKFTFLRDGCVAEAGLLSFRLYALHELLALGLEVGLVCKGVFADLRGSAFRPTDPHVVLVFRKEAHV